MAPGPHHQASGEGGEEGWLSGRTRLDDSRLAFATLLFAASEHPKTIQELLGHATMSITLDTPTYAHPETLVFATARLGVMVEGQA